ncbi:helicase C-terminal domain-containing protein [Abyssicoccus albus]|uniref:helicase C-terminal domain-containing protein n=1 Tax=Abyssicoccus albus TaxID=1817405 RepID=UPI00097E3BA1|nr:helicase C-terminal domain-containing protein [Abyssicoccus albus]AQL56168.1 hypothetical protein BVH56_04155 [Abyssicoccus albus]
MKFAFVDLETTGQSHQDDDIIEIGIVITEDLKIIDSFTSLISIEKEIPVYISSLTNIKDEDLIDQPSFQHISNHVYNMLNDCTFVAHNAKFDLEFLKYAFLQCDIEFQPELIVDTHDWFKMIYPTQSSYKLESLSAIIGTKHTMAHRAFYDAKVTAELFIHSIKKYMSFNFESKKSLIDVSCGLNFDINRILTYFQTMNKTYQINEVSSGIKEINGIFFKDMMDEVSQLNKDNLNDIKHKVKDLSFEDFCKNVLKDYEHREEQHALQDYLLSHMKDEMISIIEAPTAIGKSLTYIYNALIKYSETGERTLISTNTKLLQHELQDLMISIENSLNVKSFHSMLMGRSNYIHLPIVRKILNDDTLNYEVIILKGKLIVWLLQTNTGLVSELNLKGGANIYYHSVLNDHHNSIHPSFYDFHKNKLKNSMIGITNHSNLFVDETESLCDLYQHLIIDESHHLLNVATSNAHRQVSLPSLKKVINPIQSGHTSNIEEKLYKTLDSVVHSLFKNLHKSLQNEQSSIDVDELYIIHKLNQMQNILNDETLTNVPDFIFLDEIISNINAYLNQIEKQIFNSEFIYLNSDNKKYYETVSINYLVESPKHIIKRKLFKQYKSIHFLSGTLQVNESFSFFIQEIGLENLDYSLNSIAFKDIIDYQNNAELWVTNDQISSSYPYSNEYIQHIVECCYRLIVMPQNKGLALFTNYRMIEEVKEYFEDINMNQFPIISQHKSIHNKRILQKFNPLDYGLLLASLSFYEGVNFKAPNNTQKILLMTKLPFLSPNDPLSYYHSMQYDHPFIEYTLPKASQRFRQGIGRLLRDGSDKGIIICLDDRLTKGLYKKYFLNGLPNMQIKYYSLDEMDQQLNNMCD